MKVRNRKHLVVAILMLLASVAGMIELYQSRDLSRDYYGPIFLLIGFLWLYSAFRTPSIAGE